MSQRATSPRPASPKKKARKPSKPSSHPPVADMVRAAIVSLKDRKGSSLMAIKKYIQAKYKVDMVVIAPFIRRCLKKGVVDGSLKQASGTGASGRFRVGKAKKAKKPKKAKKAKKAKKPKKAKKAKKAKKPKAKKAKKAKKPKAKKAKKAKKPKAAKKASKPKARKPKAKKSAKKPKKAAKK
jgi:hypothetical protein